MSSLYGEQGSGGWHWQVSKYRPNWSPGLSLCPHPCSVSSHSDCPRGRFLTATCQGETDEGWVPGTLERAQTLLYMKSKTGVLEP